MKNLLILSYYYPPLGLSGVQRTVKFVKYLPQFGWNPVIITPGHRGSYVYDPSLDDDVKQAKVFRTFSLDPLFLSPPNNKPSPGNRAGVFSSINRWFIPDNKMGWVPFAVKTAWQASRRNRIDAVYSTAPPYSSHLAAVLIKKLLKKPLVTDFRDAWTEYTWAGHPTSVHRNVDRRLESWVLRNSDAVIAVNDEILHGLRRLHPGVSAGRFRLISHGYDPEDFRADAGIRRERFRIAHAGTFIKNRSPKPLLEALAIMKVQKPDLLDKLDVLFAGACRPEDAALVGRAGFTDVIKFMGYLPHRESVSVLMQSDLLWLVMGPEETANVTPGKLFEYLGSRKPIAASIPANGETARLILQTGAGSVVSPDDPAGLAGIILRHFSDWQDKKALFQTDPKKIKRFDRKLIAQQLGHLLDGLI